jgi:CRISPR-associated protein Csx16
MKNFMHYLITRHAGALEWLQQHVSQPYIHWPHLHSASLLKTGDTVVGTLPIPIIADLNLRGVYYLHLQVELPEHLRGCELTSDELTALGAQLIEYVAITVLPDELALKLAEERGW